MVGVAAGRVHPEELSGGGKSSEDGEGGGLLHRGPSGGSGNGQAARGRRDGVDGRQIEDGDEGQRPPLFVVLFADRLRAALLCSPLC